MAWEQAQAHLVETIQGTLGLTQKNGLPRKFKHVPELFDGEGGLISDSRTFGIVILSMAGRGENTVELPLWLRYEIAIVMVYRTQRDMAALYAAIASDHVKLTRQLRDTGLQDATSTIENLWAGDEFILQAEVQEVDGGLVVQSRLSIDFREE